MAAMSNGWWLLGERVHNVRGRGASLAMCGVLALGVGWMSGCDGGSEPSEAYEQARAAGEAAAADASIESPASGTGEGEAGGWEPYEGVYRAGVRDVPVKEPGTIRLTSYNLLNLFDEVNDPAYEGDVDDMHDRWDGVRAKPAEQLEAAAEAIRALDADIIGLQEIESRDALLWFRDNYLEGMGYEHVMSEDVGHARGIEQSVLSRFPIVETQTWPRKPLGARHPDDPSLMQSREREKAGQEIVFRRSPLYVVLEVPADANGAEAGADAEPYEVGIFVLHHKSGRENDYWREAEARNVIELIEGVMAAYPDRNLAVLGDFNATPGARSVRMYTEEYGLIDTLADRSAGDSAFYTHASNRAIDFILVNGELASEVVEGSSFVYAMPLRPREMDWRSTPPPMGYVSDHMPVSVDLRVGDR